MQLEINKKLILFNGDSYTAKNDFMSYSDVVQKNLPGVDVKNIALAGSSNNRIFESTIEHLARYKDTYKEIVCVIGYSFICDRFEVASQQDLFTDTERKFYDNDYGFNLNWNNRINKHEDEMYPKFITSSFLDGMTEKILRIPELTDPNLLSLSFYNDLYMFVNTLENLNIKYFVFSAATNNLVNGEKPDFLNRLQVKKYLDENKNVLINASMKKFGSEMGLELSNTYHIQHEKDFQTFGSYITNQIKRLT
jgi:hypothetical protein